MTGYIPYGMIEKQYTWELVNYQLYQWLYQNISAAKLHPVVYELIQKQTLQLELLKDIAFINGIKLVDENAKVEFNTDLLALIDELFDREYQLLQEYQSYETYFLPQRKKIQYHLKQLVEIQQGQVNTMAGLREIVRKPLPKNTGQQHHDNQQKQATNKDYWLESGYRLEKVVNHLTFPTSMTFDDKGVIYLAEAGFAYGTEPGYGRILRVERDGSLSEIANGFAGPVTSILWHKGYFYVAEGARGGTSGPGCGQITKVTPNGRKKVIIDGLKSCGDHFTGDMIIGPDERLYFTVGTATNSAVVGIDNIPWLKKYPYFSDTPARDLVLNGTNFISTNLLTEKKDVVITGAYKPFGTPSYNGEVIQGQLKANGVLYSCELDGSNLTIIADGFRNPFGLKVCPFT